MHRRQFIAATAGTVAALAFATREGRAAGPTCRYKAVTPTRLVDTRKDAFGNDTQPPLGPGSYVDVPTWGRALNGGGAIPSTARAVVLNVTCTESQTVGYVSVFPAGTNATGTSVLNLTGPGQTVAALVTVQVNSGNGVVQLFTLNGSHLIADVLGYYEEVGATREGRLVPKAPARMLDTRTGEGAFGGGETRHYQVPGAPSDATAVVVNVTIANPTGPGFWTLWAGGDRPVASNINTSFAGQVVANQAIVPLSNGGFDAYSLSGGDLILDVAGWYTGPGALSTSEGLFVPIAPARLLDTRQGGDLNPLTDQYQWRARKPHTDWIVEVPVIGRAGVPANASAVVLSVTLTSSEAPGFVTALPARTRRPEASNVNTSWAGNTVANHVITSITQYGFSLYTLGGAHLIADINGYFIGSPASEYLAKASNSPTPGLWFPTALYVPRINSSVMTCYPDTTDASLAYGPGHLVDTSFPGARGNCAVFGHRTSHTHPFLYIDQLQYGDAIEFSSAQGVATYTVYEVDPIVSPDDPTMYYSGVDTPTCTLIACTPPHSTKYRIVARGILVDYVES